MKTLTFLILILNQVLSTRIYQKFVTFSSNLKYANATALLGRNRNNETYFNSTVETFEDLAKMMVRNFFHQFNRF